MECGAGGYKGRAVGEDRETIEEESVGMSESLGVYLSVPFCKAKCTFCNFASDAFAPGRMQGYVERMVAEVRGARAAAERLGAEVPEGVDSIYFGGGTPSLLGATQFAEIFAALGAEFMVAADAEVTLECAPGQLADGTLEELQRQGMNRISFGVQSFVDRETAAIGRLHTGAMCVEEMARVRRAGVENVCLDLIVGLPHQTEESWRYSLRAAVASGAEHVSLYLLEVDEESRLGREMLAKGTRYSAGLVPSEDEAADWYLMGCEQLGAAGIPQYEISNFARVGRRSRHNMKYWTRQPYLGFGLDAHSMLKAGEGAMRFANTSELDVYVGGEAVVSGLNVLGGASVMAEPERVGVDGAFEETLFLGLRMNEGVSLRALRGQFGESMVRAAGAAVDEVREAGLLEVDGDWLRLTSRGRMVSNEVFSRLLISAAA
jgi:oxygen-independent coproporphyrinogen-3 oxidase